MVKYSVIGERTKSRYPSNSLQVVIIAYFPEVHPNVLACEESYEDNDDESFEAVAHIGVSAVYIISMQNRGINQSRDGVSDEVSEAASKLSCNPMSEVLGPATREGHVEVTSVSVSRHR